MMHVSDLRDPTFSDMGHRPMPPSAKLDVRSDCPSPVRMGCISKAFNYTSTVSDFN